MNRRVLFGVICLLVIISVIIVYFATRGGGADSSVVKSQIQSTTIPPTDPPTTIPPLVVPECPSSYMNTSLFELKNVRVEATDLLNALQNCSHIRIIRLLGVETIGRFDGRKVLLPRLIEFTWNRIMFDPDRISEPDDYLKRKLDQTELRSEFLFFDTVAGARADDLSGALGLNRLQLSIRQLIFLRIFRSDGQVKLANLGPVANSILRGLYDDPSFQLRNLTTHLVTVNVDFIRVMHLKVLKFYYGSLYSNKSLTLSSLIRRCVVIEEIHFHIFENSEFLNLATEDLRGLGYLTRVFFKYGGPGLNSIRFRASPGVGLPQVEYFGLNVDFGVLDPNLVQDFPRIFPNLKEFGFEAYDFKYYDPILYQALQMETIQSIKIVLYSNPGGIQKPSEHSEEVSSSLKNAGIKSESDFILTKNEEQKWVGRPLDYSEKEDTIAVRQAYGD